MNKSRRHHYVPQFQTKHFANENDRIFVYDKIADKFYENGAVNLFVEKDRNTFPNLDGIDDDVIERIYASFDDMFDKVLLEITSQNQVSGKNYKLLLFLAYVSKWRVPQYDESFNTAKEDFSVDDLGLGLKNDKEERLPANLETLFGLDMQQEVKRFLLAIQPFRFKEDYKRLLDNSFIIETYLPSFISDCPFNEATIEDGNLFEDFVFPITKNLTLVYSIRIDRNEIRYFLLNGKEERVQLFQRDFATSRDISLLDLAERNVACCDEGYLKHLVTNYKQFKAKGTGTAYHLTVFNKIYRFREYAHGLI